MDTVQELNSQLTAEPRVDDVRIQPGGYLLELSLDWIVLRASENIHNLLGESHVTLIEESLGRFVHSQALHDLRNLFSRLSGTTGIARAYAVRLTEDHQLVDIAFQLVDGRVLLEAVPSAGSFGDAFGTVGGLIAGLANSRNQALINGGARRMRALTGYDRVILTCAGRHAESSRGVFSGVADPTGLPIIIADPDAGSVAMFPRDVEETSLHAALMRAPTDEQRRNLAAEGVRAILRVPFVSDGIDCGFCCENRSPCAPNFELHAAAELFAQMFALRLELDQATKR
jgi:light-regulated signal transduction histidine kinase (bacteriophytochrome)